MPQLPPRFQATWERVAATSFGPAHLAAHESESCLSWVALVGALEVVELQELIESSVDLLSCAADDPVQVIVDLRFVDLNDFVPGCGRLFTHGGGLLSSGCFVKSQFTRAEPPPPFCAKYVTLSSRAGHAQALEGALRQRAIHVRRAVD